MSSFSYRVDLESSPKAVALKLDNMRDRFNQTEFRKRRRSIVRGHGIKNRKKDANYKQLLPKIPPSVSPCGRKSPYYRNRTGSVEPTMTPLPKHTPTLSPLFRDIKINL